VVYRTSESARIVPVSWLVGVGLRTWCIVPVSWLVGVGLRTWCIVPVGQLIGVGLRTWCIIPVGRLVGVGLRTWCVVPVGLLVGVGLRMWCIVPVGWLGVGLRTWCIVPVSWLMQLLVTTLNVQWSWTDISSKSTNTESHLSRDHHVCTSLAWKYSNNLLLFICPIVIAHHVTHSKIAFFCLSWSLLCNNLLDSDGNLHCSLIPEQ